jgi:hypothetical protein
MNTPVSGIEYRARCRSPLGARRQSSAALVDTPGLQFSLGSLLHTHFDELEIGLFRDHRELRERLVGPENVRAAFCRRFAETENTLEPGLTESESAVLLLNSPTRWKAKFGRMDVSEARKLRTLKTENSRLKMLLISRPPNHCPFRALYNRLEAGILVIFISFSLCVRSSRGRKWV